MRKKYGNTWWGKKFLNAFNQIDWSNRLPRGRTYANKGAVREIIFDGEEVNASVQGSSWKPYRQTIKVPHFKKAERQQVLDIIIHNPFILTQLLNKELPKELFEELENEGIKLFPNSWRDMRATCSCPDGAVPCKHIAAVIYLIANNIDQDPFLVFSLKGMDLLEEIQDKGFNASGALKANLISAHESLLKEPEKNDEFSFSETLAKIDFTGIPESQEQIFELLDNHPPFYPVKNFKFILEDTYWRISRIAKKEIHKKDEPEGIYSSPGTVSFIFDKQFLLKDIELELFGGNTFLAGESGNPIEELIELIEKIPMKDLPKLSPYVSVLVFAYQFVWHLAQKGAFIPQILQVSEKTFRLRWIPALLDESVKAIFQRLVEAVPGDLITFQTTKKQSYTSSEEQIFWICSSFFEWMILEHIPADIDHPVGDLFFLNFDFHIRKFEDEQTPYSIQQWLQRFYLHQRDYTLVLKIEEIDEFFGLSMFIEDKKNPLDSLVSLQQLFEEEDLEEIRLSVLQDLALLAEYFEPVKKIIESKGKHQPRMGSIAFIPVLTRSIPLLKLLGVKVLLPKSLRKIAYPQLSVQLDSKESPVSAQSFLNLDEMLNFNWQVAIGDQLVDPYDFLNKVQGLSGLVKIYDTYVMLDQKEMQALLKKLKDPPELSHADLLKTGLTESFEDAKVKLSAKARSIIQSLLESEEIAPPQGLMANLRPYQQRGYEWMYKNAKIGFGSLLADDMGLGKTIQVISLLQQMKDEGQLEKRKGLIVVPTTLLTNWKNEIHKFAPELVPSIYHGPNRQMDLANSDLIITTYGVIRSDIETLKKIKWAILIIDEAQNIKNPGTIQSKSIQKIKAHTRVALSGTPVENRLSEYWSIFDFVNKGYLKTLTSFKKEFINPIEKDRDAHKLEAFRQITSPFILRRLKTDKTIIKDLPEKIENNILCNLSVEQSALYQNIINLNLQQIEENEGIARAGAIFKLMNALKQICNHPSHFLKKEQIDPEVSGKSSMLITLMNNIRENGEKCLIFTQYTEMGTLLENLLKKNYGDGTLFLHGGLTRNKRDEIVSAFQEKPFIHTMILSLKAGGTGLNLTAANHVIHYDLWWNPAVENQATDRAFRIGQKKNVMVYRLITEGTFEEKIDEMIHQKKELADMTVSTGEKWIGELSNDELKRVFQL